MGCVYLATNRINGKQYVGQSVDLDRRKKGHKRNATKGINYPFYCAIRKYGFDVFDWKLLYYREMLSRKKDKAAMNRWERYYIKKLNTMVPNGYNLTTGGEGMDSESAKKSHSRLEVRIKLKLSAIEINNRPGMRKRKSKSAKKSWADPKVIAHHKEANLRPEVKARRSAASTEISNRPEMKERFRISHLGPRPPEIGLAISKAKKAKNWMGWKRCERGSNGRFLMWPKT